MIKTGDLVKWVWSKNASWLAIVIGEPFGTGGTSKALVQWVTGRYAGQEDYIHTEELEVIA